MAETLACPACKAELVLPTLPKGQTVQCPRCRHVFEPGYAPPPVPKLVATPVPQRTIDIPRTDSRRAIADDPRPVAYDDSLRHQWKGPTAIFFVAVCILFNALHVYIHIEQSLVIHLQQELGLQRPDPGKMFRMHANRRGPPPPHIDRQLEVDRRWNNVQQLAEFVQVLHHLVFWPTVFFVVLWFHQATRNLRVLKAGGLIYSPSTAVLSFFIPIINLLQPFSVMQEIWRASDPRVAGAPRSWQQAPYSITARIWWLAYLGAGVLSLFALWMGRDFFLDDSELVTQALTRLLSHLCMIVAGVALILLIHGIQVRQRQRYARLYEEAA